MCQGICKYYPISCKGLTCKHLWISISVGVLKPFSQRYQLQSFSVSVPPPHIQGLSNFMNRNYSSLLWFYHDSSYTHSHACLSWKTSLGYLFLNLHFPTQTRVMLILNMITALQSPSPPITSGIFPPINQKISVARLGRALSQLHFPLLQFYCPPSPFPSPCDLLLLPFLNLQFPVSLTISGGKNLKFMCTETKMPLRTLCAE